MTIEPHDPARSGSPIPAGPDAWLSRNEVETLCLKAARGAGMSWGLAEEAGFAAGWLAARGLDGPGVLLEQLQRTADRGWQRSRPVPAPGHWRACDHESLCPIALGVTLCDFAALPGAALSVAPMRAGPLDAPLLLLPFLAGIATMQGAAVQLGWDRGNVTLGGGARPTGDIARLARAERIVVELSLCETRALTASGMCCPFMVRSETLRGLHGFASRTTVPASTASRAGAGAAVEAND